MTTTTLATVMTTTGLTAGWWHARYLVKFQTAATGTGIAFGLGGLANLNAGTFQAIVLTVTTGGAAATGVADSNTTTVAGQMAEGKQGSTTGAIIGSAFAGVDAANATITAVVEASFQLTGAGGDLLLQIASEVGGSAVRVMAGTLLDLHKIS